MTSTAYNPPPSPDQAQGYEGSVDGPIPPPWPMALSLAYASGGIVSTTHDMALWQTKLLSGQVLSPASLKQMTTPFKNNYGFGVWVAERDRHIDISHDGVVPGFRTIEHYEPDDRLSVVVLGNLDTSAPDILGNNLLKVARGLPGQLPPKPYPGSPAALASYVGTYVISPKLQAIVTYENGQLILAYGVNPKLTFYGESETLFFSKIWEYATLEFVKAADGTMSVILHFTDGEPDEVGKREPA